MVRACDHFIYPTICRPDWICLKGLCTCPDPIPVQRSSANMRRPAVIVGLPSLLPPATAQGKTAPEKEEKEQRTIIAPSGRM